ncbi:MAG: CoA-binding protein [Omnitrophica WOR_2 bacterium SM23_29]|nr:MAG: CoA-binding protein [Omnitrophica WOR_2 bacterium SM23_29]
MPQTKSIAVIGASNKRNKFGNKAVRAYLQKGYAVYPIHPLHETIEGIKAYKSVLDIPEDIDAATFYVPSSVGLKVVEEVAKKGIKEIYLNPGAESEELIRKAKALGLKVVQACSIFSIGISPAEL